MSSATPPFTDLAGDFESLGATPENVDRLARELARTFGVRPDEVGLMRVVQQQLVFFHPEKLQNVGSIPLNHRHSIAVRSVLSKKPELLNNFATTRHASVFESVDLRRDAAPGDDFQARTIQKLMSAPVIGRDGVLGVIQVCRKGATPADAGRDFTPAELRSLATIAEGLAKCFQ